MPQGWNYLPYFSQARSWLVTCRLTAESDERDEREAYSNPDMA